MTDFTGISNERFFWKIARFWKSSCAQLLIKACAFNVHFMCNYTLLNILRSFCEQKCYSFLHTSGSYTDISFANKIKNKSDVLILIMKNFTLSHDVKVAKLSKGNSVKCELNGQIKFCVFCHYFGTYLFKCSIQTSIYSLVFLRGKFSGNTIYGWGRSRLFDTKLHQCARLPIFVARVIF